jgi:glutamate racemase
MLNRPILFLDSGIGGIPYCRHFLSRNPGERVVYLADRLHFPYGRRTKDEIAAIVSGLMETLIQTVNPKIAVIACNTATIAALDNLRARYPQLPFVGTVPAVKPAALRSKTGKIGVLGTELTVNQPYIRELAAQFGGPEIFGIAAPELVEFVESRLLSASAEEKRAMARGYIDRFRTAGVDALVLGCTHFLFLLEEFRTESSPDIAMHDSIEGISRRIESLIKASAEQRPAENAAPNRLVLTGGDAPEASWTGWAERLGFSLSLLGER